MSKQQTKVEITNNNQLKKVQTTIFLAWMFAFNWNFVCSKVTSAQHFFFNDVV